MSKKIISYYTVLAMIVGVQLLATLYNGSLVVFRTQELHDLKVTRKQLSEQNSVLQAQLSQQNSLTMLAESAKLSEYTVVSRPLSISAHSSVALNNL